MQVVQRLAGIHLVGQGSGLCLNRDGDEVEAGGEREGETLAIARFPGSPFAVGGCSGAALLSVGLPDIREPDRR